MLLFVCAIAYIWYVLSISRNSTEPVKCYCWSLFHRRHTSIYSTNRLFWNELVGFLFIRINFRQIKLFIVRVTNVVFVTVVVSVRPLASHAFRSTQLNRKLLFEIPVSRYAMPDAIMQSDDGSIDEYTICTVPIHTNHTMRWQSTANENGDCRNTQYFFFRFFSFFRLAFFPFIISC